MSVLTPVGPGRGPPRAHSGPRLHSARPGVPACAGVSPDRTARVGPFRGRLRHLAGAARCVEGLQAQDMGRGHAAPASQPLPRPWRWLLAT